MFLHCNRARIASISHLAAWTFIAYFYRPNSLSLSLSLYIYIYIWLLNLRFRSYFFSVFLRWGIVYSLNYAFHVPSFVLWVFTLLRSVGIIKTYLRVWCYKTNMILKISMFRRAWTRRFVYYCLHCAKRDRQVTGLRNSHYRSAIRQL